MSNINYLRREGVFVMNEEVKSYYGYIYRTDFPDGRYYIGLHSGSTFKTNHFGDCIIIKDYIKLHGKDQLRCALLEWAQSKEELYELLEKYVTVETLNDPMCINKAIDAVGGDRITCLGEERKSEIYQKISSSVRATYESEEFKAKKPEISKELSEIVTKHWQDPDIRQRRIEKIRENAANPEFRQKLKDAKARQWKEVREKAQEKFNSIRHWYNNGTYQAFMFVEDVPPGWVLGKLYEKYPEDWKLYNNGIFSIVYKETPIIDGYTFKKGKLRKYNGNHKK